MRVFTSIFVTLFFVFDAAPVANAPGYKTIVLSKGNVDFHLKRGDQEEWGRYCPSGICTCKADLRYVGIATLTPVNQLLKDEVEKTRCRYLDAISTARQKVTYISGNLVSVVSRTYSLQFSAGGSCHSGASVHTFNLSTGKEYVLADIVDNWSLKDLRAGLPPSLVTEHIKQQDEEDLEEEKNNGGPPANPAIRHPAIQRPHELEIAAHEIENLSDEQLLSHNFFIQNKQVFIDIAGYYFSCAEGVFHPAMIPAKFVRNPLFKQVVDRSK
jgi:hypothetical protein